jgi:tetratricopeptide (TPR) repeat protein
MRSALLILFCCMAVSAVAESFQARLQKAHEHLQSGNAAKARELYEQLQIDEPDAEIVRYGIATSFYREAERALQEGEPEKAESAFASSEEAYKLLLNAENDQIRTSALFAEANIAAARAKMKLSPEQYDESVASFRQAVSNYEALVRDYPDFAPARQNLDHMRYQLKKLLQEPPPEEEQDQEQDQEEGLFIGFTDATTELPGKQAVIEQEGLIVNLTDQAAGGNPPSPAPPERASSAESAEEVAE